MITDTRPLKEAIAAALARLVSVRVVGEASVVGVPVSYPSGAFAAVHISISGDKCFVSDCALGMREAEMAGTSDFYDASAKEAAAWFGVGYDGASVFAASAPLERIEGVIVAVANASAMAVSRALYKALDAKERQSNTLVFDLVSEIFGRNNVTKQQELTGKNTVWPAHNVVTFNGRKAVFEFVGDNGNAIASKFFMFSDLAQADKSPSLNSVVKSLESLSAKGKMLSDVSNVVSMNAAHNEFRRLALVAA